MPDHPAPGFPNAAESALPDLDMILVPGGSFRMGSQDDEAQNDELPVHPVQLSAFRIGKYPVTQALWKAVMGPDNNPSRFPHDGRPVESVSWNDAQDFIRRLNEFAGRKAPGTRYRLPTEAEWEYAARGGPLSRGHKYAGSDKLKEVAWYAANSHGETQPIGMKDPNELGLYDMSGNVWEWVEDQWHRNYDGAPADGSAWVDREQGTGRVLRGGSWDGAPFHCRVAYRSSYDLAYRYDDLGFRLVLALHLDGS